MKKISKTFDGSVTIGDIYRIIGVGDFFNGDIGQLVQIEQLYADDNNTEYVQFKYFNRKGRIITCVTTFTTFHNVKATIEKPKSTHASVDINPTIETRISGRKIWYQYDSSHVTPKPKGPFPLLPSKTYGGRNFFGRWVYIPSGKTMSKSFGLALPFHLNAPAGSGIEEHGPPVITLNRIAALYKYRVLDDYPSRLICTSLRGIPALYTFLEEVSEADIAMLMVEMQLDPTKVIPFLKEEYEKDKKNIHLII